MRKASEDQLATSNAWPKSHGSNRNPALNAVAVASRLAASPKAAPRWAGKIALRDLTGTAMRQRLSR